MLAEISTASGSVGDFLNEYGYGAAGLIERSPYSTSAPYNDYLFDPQGSLVEACTSQANLPAGPVLYTTAFSAYGNQMGAATSNLGTEATGQDAIGFGGQWGYFTDQETYTLAGGRLVVRYPSVRMALRAYSPAACRFISRDPIDYGGGANLYAYAGGDPINCFDPPGTDVTLFGFQFSVSGVFEGLETGLAATAHQFSGGLYSGGRFQHEAGFETANDIAGVASDLLTVADGAAIAEQIGAKLLARGAERGLAGAGEDLFVGTYRRSYAANVASGVNATHTAHHVVQNAVSRAATGAGITINLRRDLHALTGTYNRPARQLVSLRDHLAADIRELRGILGSAGYDRAVVNRQLSELIRQNKAFGGFEK